MKIPLKHGEIYYLGDVPYMKLVYEYIGNDGIHKVTIPCLNFPFELKQIPKIKKLTYTDGRSASVPYIHLESDISLNASIVDTKEGPVSHVYYLDELIAPETRKMTLEEIEKKLGYPIQIISNEKEKTRNEKL